MLNEEMVGLRMLNYRIKRGIKQKDLAKMLGIAEATANQIEQNKGNAKRITLVKINLKLDELESEEK